MSGTTPTNIKALLSVEAYAKINLHSAKHSTMCLGYLVGHVENRSSDEKNKVYNVTVVDVLPICHSSAAGPIFETAGQMAQSYFPDQEVVGIYYAPDQSYGNSNKDIPVVMNNVCEVIKSNNKDKLALVVRIDTNKINPSTKSDDLDSNADPRSILTTDAFLYLSRNTGSSSQVLSSNGSRGNRQRLNSETNLESGRVVLETVTSGGGAAYNTALDSLLASMKHLTLADLQDHMMSDGGALDCRNTHINVDLKMVSKK